MRFEKNSISIQIDDIHFDCPLRIWEKYANSPWIGTFAKWTKELIWETVCQRTISPRNEKLRKVCKKYMCLLNRDWASLWKAGNNWLQSRTLAPKMFAQADRAPTLSLHLPLAEKNNSATLSWINFCKVYFHSNIYHLTHFFLNIFTQTKKAPRFSLHVPPLKWTMHIFLLKIIFF